jgi:hypothetical protein
MSRFTLICPDCHAEVSLSARRLTVRIDEGTATAGEVLFTCLSCHATVNVGVDASAVALLVLGGVTHLSLSAPVVPHPEVVPAGPAFTHDDLLDLHRALDGDTWIDRLAGRDT